MLSAFGQTCSAFDQTRRLTKCASQCYKAMAGITGQWPRVISWTGLPPPLFHNFYSAQTIKLHISNNVDSVVAAVL